MMVTLGDPPRGPLRQLAAEATACAGDPAAALGLARRLGATVPRPGKDTLARWEVLATLGAADLTVARSVEPHLDALAILAEAADETGQDGVAAAVGADDDSTWGVWAAEGPGVRVTATPYGDRWRLAGTKPWCSLADHVSHALLTAHVADGERGLFAVALGEHAAPAPARWVPRGLPRVSTGPVVLTHADAVAVGPPQWYLERPGFSWGGIGVAAVWYGATVALAGRLADQARQRTLDQLGHAHLGGVDVDLHLARLALRHSATEIDEGRAVGLAGRALASRTRRAVAEVAERTLRTVGHALGPAPLATEDAHAQRVADLTLYLRQEHAERDQAALGAALAAAQNAQDPRDDQQDQDPQDRADLGPWSWQGRTTR